MSKHKLQFHWLAEVYHKAESLVSASFFIFLSLLPRVFLLCWLVLLCHPFFLSFLPLSRSVLEKAVTLPVSVAERITLSLSLSLRLSLSDSNSTPLHTNAPTHTHKHWLYGFMQMSTNLLQRKNGDSCVLYRANLLPIYFSFRKR